MSRKLMIFFFMITLLLSGCSVSLSKKEMLDKNYEMLAKIKELESQNEDFMRSKKIIEFYNELSNENINSLVLVESRNRITQTKKYSNGVIIGNVGLQFYVLVDYYALEQSHIGFVVMDSYANSYSAQIYSNIIDETTGMAVLSFSISNIDSNINSISLGEYSDILAHLDSMEQKQLNKVTLLDNIKSSTVSYNNTTYESYEIENKNINNGSILVNIENKLIGIYSSKLNTFISSSLIRVIVDFTI